MRQGPLRPVLALLVLVSAGCAPAAKPTASPAPSRPPAVVTATVPLPALWTVHPDPGQGFSIVTPDSWDFVLRDSSSLAADLDAVARHSPELQAYFSKVLQANAEVRFLAADARSLAGGFAANANVVGSDLGSKAPSLAELSQAKLKRVATDADVAAGAKLVNTRISGHAAARLDYELTAGGRKVTVRSYLVVLDQGGHRRLVELTMGAPGEQATSVFDTIAGSFFLFG